jgi:hypothetical protein
MIWWDRQVVRCRDPAKRSPCEVIFRPMTSAKIARPCKIGEQRPPACSFEFRRGGQYCSLFEICFQGKKARAQGLGGWRPSRLASACRLSVSCQVAHAPISVIESMFGHANPPSVAAKTGPWHLGNFRSCHLVASSDRLRSVRHRGPNGHSNRKCTIKDCSP